ncbi:CoA ester lyase [Corynebacterium sp. CCM 8862]|uniref:CoA ester lyase n=1 Tax=Corynebacterium mendelii TaxID=2765362 RepID=A0A939E1H3_9CORY|nr:CoA ester lyase [Corynebacterium mendelii]MBN9644699.1 CoA ester lyase [Corynebacterium mendelii]
MPPGPAWLFAPVNRPERIPKAVERADSVILDLEDGAGNLDRDVARQTIIDSKLDPEKTIVRVIGPHDPGFAGDVAAVRQTDYRYVIVPKLRHEIPREVEGLKIIALIETPEAVLAAETFAAHPDVVALYFGAEDLIGFLGGTVSRIQPDEGWDKPRPGPYRPVVAWSRTMMHLAAGAHGKASIDAAKAEFDDWQGNFDEAADAGRSGFYATCVIHPNQVPVVRQAYMPDAKTLDWARRVVAETKHHPGAFKLDGDMVDAPLIAHAFRIVDRADRLS